MNDHTLLILIAIFVAISSIALLGQAIALIGLMFVARSFREKFLGFWPQLESILGTSRRTIEQAEIHIGKIGSSGAAILDVTQQQLVKVDGLLDDASTRAKVQLDRAEMVLDDTMTKVQQTVSIVQKGVLSPVRELHGLISGIRGALAHLSRANKPSVERIASDEEMFI